ncbi:MAG: hypothetical protein ACXWCZ_04310 [Flavisolibacter sp.]
MIIAIFLALIEYIALPVVAIIFGCTIYFFVKSRRSLRETLEANKKKFPSSSKITSPRKIETAIAEHSQHKARYEAYVEREYTQQKSTENSEVNIVEQMKATIAQQQKLLNRYLEQVAEMENEGREVLNIQNEELQFEIEKLHLTIEKKEDEINSLQQQASTAQRMTAKIEEVYEEFDLLQTKIASLEKQAGRSNELVMELEDSKQSNNQLHKDLTRKQEKLEEIMNENQRMHREIELLEDKLAEANLQRLQLQKRVQLLQDMNNDMQGISETNKKLQTEIRRIGELESMLTMMAEERDYLLRKKSDK